MKISLIFRLSFVAILWGWSMTAAQAQVTLYTEDATEPGTGYWTIETNQAQRNYSIIRFYNADHEKIYEERLRDLCLNPGRGTAACRRTARMLSSTLAQVQRSRNTSLVANGLGLYRKAQRTYAVR